MFVAGCVARPRCFQVSDGQVGGPPGEGRYETKHWPDELIETSLQREREREKKIDIDKLKVITSQFNEYKTRVRVLYVTIK